MGIRKGFAQAASVVSTAALKHVFRRPAGNFPGKVALYIDPGIIADTAGKLARGSVCVVGTNGKTTVTNMVADALEADGSRVVCNRTGANLDSGVATSMLHAKASDWGVFECDELWLAKVLPQLQSNYVVLLNLFRDQLDRVGEIDRIQESIVGALKASPKTVLIYNADDPHCERIARDAGCASIPFGIGEDLGLAQNTVADARMCQECEGMLEYDWRQYGQLGSYHCPHCGFGRTPLRFLAQNCRVGQDSMAFDVACTLDQAGVGGGTIAHVDASYAGVYMIYNLLAVFTAAHLMGAQTESIQQAIEAFDPQNGRLQQLVVDGRNVLLNLAKNPTGFNQNLKIIEKDEGPCAAAFFVNDREGDGRDVSWIWDIDFEELAGADVAAYAGGQRRNDVQVRLKYAGIDAQLVDGGADAMAKIGQLPASRNAYLIANYTSLPGVREDVVKLAQAASPQATAVDKARAAAIAEAHEGVEDDILVLPSVDSTGKVLPKGSLGATGSMGSVPAADVWEDASGVARQQTDAAAHAAVQQQPQAPGGAYGISADKPLVIVQLFPDLLNLYGDGGNAKVLACRCAWRGIPVVVEQVMHGQTSDLQDADIVVMGGGPDREQKLASEQLVAMRDALDAYVQGGGVLLAVCGGYQILGPTWLMGDALVEGVGILDIRTERASQGPERLIGDIALSSPLSTEVVIGYENHAGRTYLGPGLEPFGAVVGGKGYGNNDSDGVDGVRYKNLVGTYLHGPVLGKNPQVADWLIARAIEQRTQALPQLAPLDDAAETQANAFMRKRLGV